MFAGCCTHKKELAKVYSKGAVSSNFKLRTPIKIEAWHYSEPSIKSCVMTRRGQARFGGRSFAVTKSGRGLGACTEGATMALRDSPRGAARQRMA